MAVLDTREADLAGLQTTDQGALAARADKAPVGMVAAHRVGVLVVPLAAVLVGMVRLVADSAAAAADTVGISSAKALVGTMTETSSVHAISLFASSSRFLLPQRQTLSIAVAMLVGQWFVPDSFVCVRLLSHLLLPSQLLV